MTEQQPPPEPDAVTILLNVFKDRMTDSVKSEEDMDYKAQQAMHKTHKITHFSLYAAFILTPVIFYLIGTLVLDMSTITNRMEVMAADVAAMKSDFDQVSAVMTAIDTSVVNMSRNIAVIPDMDTQVAGMNQDFTLMVGAMGGITPDVNLIDRLLSGMDYDMAQMNNLFGHLNHNVFFMGRDVNTLSSPMRMMPFFGR